MLQNRSSFRRKAEELSNLLPPKLPSPPWQHSTPHEGRIATTVPDITGRMDDTNIKRQCSLTTMASYQADYTIYINGSTSRETRNGGAAAVVIRGSSLQPEMVTTIKTRETTFTSYYEEETAAIESALSWTFNKANHPSISILFCIDSKSLCEAHISLNPWTFSIHNSINSISSSIFIQWIPDHSAIPGNSLANKAAKEATTIATDTILCISFSSSVKVINETIRDALKTHERVALVYQHRRVSRDAKQINSRKYDVLIACLPSGHHPSLRQYLNWFNPCQDPIYPNCHLEVQDLLHWLCECPALMTIR